MFVIGTSFSLRASTTLLTEKSFPLISPILMSSGFHGQFVVDIIFPLVFFQARRYGFYSLGHAFDLIMSALSAWLIDIFHLLLSASVILFLSNFAQVKLLVRSFFHTEISLASNISSTIGAWRPFCSYDCWNTEYLGNILELFFIYKVIRLLISVTCFLFGKPDMLHTRSMKVWRL